MEVGDLVCLSARGEKLSWFRDCRGKLGIIIKEHETWVNGNYKHCFWVQFINGPAMIKAYRSDIKYAK
jgi:hypothetical protein